MFRELDPLLHSELRLAVMSILAGADEADFVYMREQTRASAGNLSVQSGVHIRRKGIQRAHAAHGMPHDRRRPQGLRRLCRRTQELHRRYTKIELR